MKGLTGPFIAVCAVALSAPAVAEDAAVASSVAAWRAVDAETGQIRDIEGLEDLARDFPDSGSVRLRMLQPLIDAGEVDKVLETLEWLYDRGYVFSKGAQAQIEKLVGSIAPGRVAERLRAEAEVIAASEVIATVPAEAGLVESVTRSPTTADLIVTSYSEGSVWTVNSEGSASESAFGSGQRFSGIIGNEQDGSLWASMSLENPLSENGHVAGLASLCLEVTCTQQQIVINPRALSATDVHATPGGTIFVSDSEGGGVYAHGPGSKSLELLIPPGNFRSPQGLATSTDGSKLYVSDYRYGIAIVDLATREVSRLTTDLPLILDGVDGLWRYKNELIVVQNGTSPMRIAAFEPSEDGLRIVGHRILEQANPEWTEPLSGSIDGDALIYIGNGQWDRYVDGELAEGKEALPTQIRRLPLD